MEPSSLVWAALLLSVERLCYAFAWRRPELFRRVSLRLGLGGGDPVRALERLFYAFKGLQLSVFLAWCLAHGDGTLWPPSGPPVLSALLGLCILAAGQLLNLSVFYRLGRTGVFYGSRFGYRLPICRQFPFSWLRHPQYVGTVLSIWGLFVVLRFPHDDWLVLPVLQTLYYAVGAYLES